MVKIIPHLNNGELLVQPSFILESVWGHDNMAKAYFR